MPNKREGEKERYSSTACGIFSFISFFMGGCIALIVAEETGKYYYYIVLLGNVMICAAVAVFFGLMNEKNIQTPKPDESNEPQSEQGLLLQQQPESETPDKSKTEPHWYHKTRFDFAYVRQVIGLPPTDSIETTSSENDSDPDLLELRRMAKYGLPPDGEEPVAGSSKVAQDENTTGCEDAVDLQMDSTKAGPSKVVSKSSETTQPKYDYLPMKDMSALLLSGSSKCIAAPEKKADVSAALSQMCLDGSDNEAAKFAAYDSFSTDSESKSDDQYMEDNIPTLESKKEA